MATHGVQINSKVSMPKGEADHPQWAVDTTAWPITSSGEGASEHRADTQCLEVGSAGPRTIHVLCLSPSREVKLSRHPCARALEQLRPLLDLFPDGVAPILRGPSCVIGDQHEALGLSDRERSEQEVVHERENGGVSAHAQRQR